MPNKKLKITEKDKKNIYKKILNCKDFKDSAIYQKLLTYLVDSYFNNKTPKETSIAIEIFGKSTDFNSNKDSTVRYHMHTLRGKLANYYKNEGKHDKIKFVIPKGHYEVDFIQREEQKENFYTQVILKKNGWAFGIILLLILSNIFLLLKLNNIRSEQNSLISQQNVNIDDPLWGTFFKNNYPVSVIMGDDFMLDEYCNEYKRYRQIRDWKIDSKNDLYDFLVQHPDANIWASEISGVPFGGEQNLVDLLSIIYPFQTDINLMMSSNLTLDLVRDHNIIYIGEFKNLRVLDKIIAKLPIRYQYHPDEQVFITDADTTHSFLRIQAPYEQKDKYNVDYSLLIKMPGFSQENIMFIVGFGYGGRLERTKMLNNPELRGKFIENLKASHHSIPEYFIALFEVKSIERTGFTDELKYFQEIPADFFGN